MESIASRASNRIESRVIHSTATLSDSPMTVSTEDQVISFPVRTQLGLPLSVSVGDDVVSPRLGQRFICDAGTAAKPTKKPTYGLIRYLAGVEVDSDVHVQLDVKLYVSNEKYITIWDMSARGQLPQQIMLQVMGLQGAAQWDTTEVGSMLLIEDFSFSYPIGVHGP